MFLCRQNADGWKIIAERHATEGPYYRPVLRRGFALLAETTLLR